MSMFDDIALVGSRLGSFFDEDNQQKIEPTVPSSINVSDVAGYFNPKLHLLDGLATGQLTQESLNKYKEAKGIQDLFKVASEASYTGTKKNPFETSGQAISRALDAPTDDSKTFDAISRARVASATFFDKTNAEQTPIVSSRRDYDAQTQKNDALIPEAFGAFDQLQMGAARVGSYLGVDKIVGPFESNLALAAREGLNRDILAIGASLYSGRPSKFLLEQIQKTIPVGASEGDDLAYSKYVQAKNIFRDQIRQMEGLRNNAKTKAKRIEFENKLGDLNYMVDRLSVVTGAFEKAGTGRKEFYESEGMFGGEFTEQDLNDLNNYFEQ